jgi:beta-lactamase class A
MRKSFLCGMRDSRFMLAAVATALGFGLGTAGSLQGSVLPGLACDSAYPFLNPWLRCEPVEDLKKKEYTEFKGRVESYIADGISSGDIHTVAVYFRDLENGPWFGIEEDALFSPASMLKLPVLIAYYRQAEFHPSLLEREIEIAGSAPSLSNDENQEMGSLQVGGSYTIEELLRRMIVYSDNAPLHLLLSYLKQFYPDDDVFAETLAAMGIAKSEGSEEDFLTVKRYSSIYRALYNASFLSKEMSQRALDLLTHTSSPRGIDDGVPSGTPVAHKYGIRSSEGQLHDCGIVYHPENHYILCIMTKGTDTVAQGDIMAEISGMVYEEVQSRSR